MKRGLKEAICLGLLNLVLVPGSCLLHAQNKAGKEAPPMKLKMGDPAPDFTLLAFDGKELKKVSLQDYREKECRSCILCLRLHRWLNSRNESSPAESLQAGGRRHPGSGCEHG